MTRAVVCAQKARLTLEALVWVLLVRTELWLHPYQTILRRTRLRSRTHLPRGTGRVPRSVARAACLVPGASCLTQAIAVKIMLARRGIGSTLHLGVEHDAAGAFKAHAWVEIDSEVVIGGTRESIRRYNRIASHGYQAA